MVLARVDSAAAATLVKEIDAGYTEVVRVERRSAGRSKLVGGGVLIAIGAGIFAGTAYFSGAGGFYIFPVGFIIGGIYYLIKGTVEASGAIGGLHS